MKYRLNIFLLHKYALKIQHWFFLRRFNKARKQASDSCIKKKQIATTAQSNQTKFRKINGSSRLPKAAEKELQKHQQAEMKKEV